MAEIVEKLYPPVITDSIPAFYSENGTAAIIAVPFSMNRAVKYDDITGFKLKIKTAQSNTYLTTLSNNSNTFKTDLANGVIHFNWENTEEDQSFSKIVIGQFLKIQLAYCKNNIIGYYSTVGIIKYTSKPTISLVLKEDNQIQFQKTYYGKYDTGLDQSERPYSYIFSLYSDYGNTLVETSGWKICNLTIKNFEENNLNLTYNSYTFESSLIKNQLYYIQYGIKTINNLEIYTSLLPCKDIDIGIPSIDNILYAKNVFNDGYIELFFSKDNEIFSSAENFNNPIFIEILRAEKTDNFSFQQTIKKICFFNPQEIFNWSFKDFAIEQGVWYKYFFRQYYQDESHTSSYTAKDYYTKKEEVFADFEDIFLWDGERQLKIRFNPKMSSFKTTLLESKIDTIGSSYPFIFRNGSVAYKEFPISGLISYLTDENSLFLNHITDLDIYMADTLVRGGSPSDETQYLQTSTTNFSGYNISAERKFKIKVLDWLNNGKIKLFRSPVEGNYLVRLMNISLSPEDRLGRMLHTFSATAYETEKFSYKNLSVLGITKIEDIKEGISTGSISLAQLVRDNFNKIQTGESIKINRNKIINFLCLKTLNNNSPSNLYIRIGKDSLEQKIAVSTANFVLQSQDNYLPDIYFNGQDNNNENEQSFSLESLITLVNDISFIYQYKLSDSEEITQENNDENIDNILIENIVETFVGPTSKTFYNEYENVTESLLQLFALNFRRKIEIPKPEQDLNPACLNEDCLYYIEKNNHKIYYMLNSEKTELESITLNNEEDNEIILVDINNLSYHFNTIPSIDLTDKLYKEIKLGAWYCADCAYQVKKIFYKNNNE